MKRNVLVWVERNKRKVFATATNRAFLFILTGTTLVAANPGIIDRLNAPPQYEENTAPTGNTVIDHFLDAKDSIQKKPESDKVDSPIIIPQQDTADYSSIPLHDMRAAKPLWFNVA